MVKHSQAIRPLLPINCLNLFDHFVGRSLMALGLKVKVKTTIRMEFRMLKVEV